MTPKFSGGGAGDKDYKQIVKNALDGIRQDIEINIDPKDFNTILLHEVTKCLRKSYYDRVDPVNVEESNLNQVLGGVFRQMKSKATTDNYKMKDGVELKGQADMIESDVIMIFRSIEEFPESPLASDILYLNACMWIFDKIEGIITYITRGGKEDSFVVNRNQKMFEEVVRRAMVLHDLLKRQSSDAKAKPPIIEPSVDCNTCQYYSRCYIKKKEGKPITFRNLFGSKD